MIYAVNEIENYLYLELKGNNIVILLHCCRSLVKQLFN